MPETRRAPEKMPDLMSSDPCEMDSMQCALHSFFSFLKRLVGLRHGLWIGWGQEAKVNKEEEKEKSSSCDTQSGAKTVVLGKSGGLSWGQEDSP